CSKRWLGNLNFLLRRKSTLEPANLTTLFPIFHQRKVDAVLITGDLTSTSHKEEFILAQQFIDSLKQEKFKVFTLPGNHDQYTKKAYRDQLFYQFFNVAYASPTDPLPLAQEISLLSLKEDGLASAYFGQGWWLIGLDTAIA